MIKVVFIDVKRTAKLSFFHSSENLSLDTFHLENHLHCLVKILTDEVSRVVFRVLRTVE
jgi:hypothetical protein